MNETTNPNNRRLPSVESIDFSNVAKDLIPREKYNPEYQNDAARSQRRTRTSREDNKKIGLWTKIGLWATAVGIGGAGAKDYVDHQLKTDLPPKDVNARDVKSFSQNENDTVLVDGRVTSNNSSEVQNKTEVKTEVNLNKKQELEKYLETRVYAVKKLPQEDIDNKTVELFSKEPSISLEKFMQVLNEKHAPLNDFEKRAVYSMFVDMEIDPNIALAFYAHETIFGTSNLSKITHSWGNDIYTDENPALYEKFPQVKRYILSGKDIVEYKDFQDIQTVKEADGTRKDITRHWKQYSNSVDGAIRWALMMQGYYNVWDSNGAPLRKLPDIIHVYAPGSDYNDESAYVKSLLSNSSEWSKSS